MRIGRKQRGQQNGSLEHQILFCQKYTNRPDNIRELKQRIGQEMYNTSPMLQDVSNNFIHRLDYWHFVPEEKLSILSFKIVNFIPLLVHSRYYVKIESMKTKRNQAAWVIFSKVAQLKINGGNDVLLKSNLFTHRVSILSNLF